MDKIKWILRIKYNLKIGSGIFTSNFLRMILKLILGIIILNAIIYQIDKKVLVSIRTGYEKMMIKIPPESRVTYESLANNNISEIIIHKNISISYVLSYDTKLKLDDILLYYQEEFENKGVHLQEYGFEEDTLNMSGEIYQGNQQYLMQVRAIPSELDQQISVSTIVYDNKTNVLYVLFKRILYLILFVLIIHFQMKVFKKELIKEDLVHLDT